MPKRYYCEYCDCFLKYDSLAARRDHNCGKNHRNNVRKYYMQFLEDPRFVPPVPIMRGGFGAPHHGAPFMPPHMMQSGGPMLMQSAPNMANPSMPPMPPPPNMNMPPNMPFPPFGMGMPPMMHHMQPPHGFGFPDAPPGFGMKPPGQ